MTPKLHRTLLATAADVSPALHNHMRQLGPVTMPNRKPLGIAQFLARVIIGQQLSTKAANTIWNRIRTAAKDSEQRIPAFFTQENLATLRACGASGNKAKALLAINEAHNDG
ncbi:MAG: DNA-3-methyladenine glycosylase family protein, partial [Gammaproteobacteria bacterium]